MSEDAAPLSLTDNQMDTVLQGAQPLPPRDRDRYLQRVAHLLRGQILGDGAVSRAARQAQAELFRAPRINGHAGVPQHERKLLQRER
jgi:hypothetical protein